MKLGNKGYLILGTPLVISFFLAVVGLITKTPELISMGTWLLLPAIIILYGSN